MAQGNKIEFFLEGNVPSLKNSKVKTKWGLIPSKTVRRYVKEKEYQYKDDEFRERFKEALEGKEFPIKLHMYIIRDSRRKFDYVNIAQLPLDLLVKHGHLPDDNADIVIPVFDGYHVDKKEAGMKLWIE